MFQIERRIEQTPEFFVTGGIAFLQGTASFSTLQLVNAGPGQIFSPSFSSESRNLLGSAFTTGVLLTCEPATVLPMAQRYFLF